jgi:Uma2 family endonuclease
MQTQELDFPDHVKPYVESIRGRWIPKVSPRKRHALVQLRLGTTLAQWAAKRGDVGTEWRCRLLSSTEKPSSLVPDVCFVSNERQKDLSEEERERPPFAPDIAAEDMVARRQAKGSA